MGNTVSGEKNNRDLVTTRISRHHLKALFRKEAKDSMSNIELISISHFLFGNIKGLSETITYESLLLKLNLHQLYETERGAILYKILKNLSNWPCLNEFDNEEKPNEFTLYDILIIVYILNCNGFEKLGFNYYDYYVKLIFILISSQDPDEKSEKNFDDNDTQIDLISHGDKIKWDLLPLVQSFDRIEYNGITKSKLEIFLNILLPLSIFELNSNSFELDYSTQIHSIISTLYLSSTEETLGLSTFIANFKNYTPYLFKPLNELLKPVILDQHVKGIDKETNVENEEGNGIIEQKLELNHKILNFQLLSQLSTIFDISGLNINVNSKPLYQGSKHGYSINSIQSRTLNYNASTILLISGKTINKDRGQNKAFFKKFPKFHPVVISNVEIKERQKFQIAVLMTNPWRITNTKNFGSKEFKIIQLSPYQLVLNANNSIPENYAYFSNIGLGLGFGSKPPSKFKDIKNNNINFNIGGTSLTIDNSLETGNFRIEDMSKLNSTYRLDSIFNNDSLYNDIWFKISEIEIYGLGDVQILEDQKRAMEWEEREAERRRGIGNKDYNEGRALLELAGIIGGSCSGGSI
jgi:hypothetical protein